MNEVTSTNVLTHGTTGSIHLSGYDAGLLSVSAHEWEDARKELGPEIDRAKSLDSVIEIQNRPIDENPPVARSPTTIVVSIASFLVSLVVLVIVRSINRFTIKRPQT